MLIPKIVAEIDAQLERLQAAREELALLVEAPAPKVKKARKALETRAAEETEPAPMTGRVEAHRERSTRARRTPRAVEPSALGKSFPAGPVVVSAAAMQQRTDAKAVAAPAATAPHLESGFEALLREATERTRAVAG